MHTSIDLSIKSKITSLIFCTVIMMKEIIENLEFQKSKENLLFFGKIISFLDLAEI